MSGKRKLARKAGKKGLRYVRSVGLGFKTPREAIEVCALVVCRPRWRDCGWGVGVEGARGAVCVCALPRRGLSRAGARLCGGGGGAL